MFSRKRNTISTPKLEAAQGRDHRSFRAQVLVMGNLATNQRSSRRSQRDRAVQVAGPQSQPDPRPCVLLLPINRRVRGAGTHEESKVQADEAIATAVSSWQPEAQSREHGTKHPRRRPGHQPTQADPQGPHDPQGPQETQPRVQAKVSAHHEFKTDATMPQPRP